MTECAYCGCSPQAHDPVYVTASPPAEASDPDAYCNYGCLAAHIDAENLAVGTTCRVDL